MLADIRRPVYTGTIKALALSRWLMHTRLLWCLWLHMRIEIRLLRLRRLWLLWRIQITRTWPVLRQRRLVLMQRASLIVANGRSHILQPAH